MNIKNITMDKIKKLIDKDTFSKGYDYYQKGRVGEIIKLDDIIKATVFGRRQYSVIIDMRNKEFKKRCTCPVGGLCKHIAAVLLSIANDEKVEKIDIKGYLNSRNKDELIEIILNRSVSDIDFLKHLSVKANVSLKKIDKIFFKKRIDNLFNESDNIDYSEVYDYVQKLEEFLIEIESLIDKFPRETAEILFYFIKKTVEIYEDTGLDDSSGNLGEFIIALGIPCARAVRLSKFVIPAKEFVDIYFKLSDYGVDDCLDFVLPELPESSLKEIEICAKERYFEVKNNKDSWKYDDEKYFYAAILVLLGKKKEYHELYENDKETIKELELLERGRRSKR